MHPDEYDFIIIGGGIIGLSTAYKLCLKYPQKKILVLEKENDVAMHQTGRNSGVIHSGIYYKPGSKKAQNCVNGRKELVEFAKKHKIPHDVCGKIIVATQQSEVDHMKKVFNNGLANHVEGIEIINDKKIQEIEPFCKGIAGIWVPCTGIIDFKAVCRQLKVLIESANQHSHVATNQELIAFEKHDNYSLVYTSNNFFKGKYIIVCGGLHSDRLAKKDGCDIDSAIVGFRGDYYNLTEKGMKKVKNLIYPVPNPKFPFLGVHFTRMTNGSIECGPNAVFVFKREGYKKTDFSLKDTYDALKFKGTLKFFKDNWRFGLDEYRGAFSKNLFLRRLQMLIPSLELDDITVGRSGVRAMSLNADGEMVDDFKIERSGNTLHILNAPSPAATACLAIGEEIANMVSIFFRI